MKTIKPISVLIFIVLVMLVLAGVSAVFPKDGILIFNQKFLFPNLNSYFSSDKNQKTDISKIVALADAEDNLSDSVNAKSDSLIKKEIDYKEVNDTSIKLITSIQYKDSAKNSLYNFFQSLAELTVDESETVRILHYGDSQIEGDRITDYLRQKLQTHFGGKGPGFIAAMPVAQSVGLKQSWSDNWDRYTIFTSKDSRVPNNNYGVAAGFCRYAIYKDTAEIKNAWLKIKTTQSAGGLFAAYNKVKLFYASSTKNTQIQFLENDVLKKTDTLDKGSFNVEQFNLSQAPNTFEIKFQGKNSPDIFGLSLEGNGGVMVDNFGLRGSSGTFFNQMNLQHLKLFYDYLNAKFIILQFGGNALPSIPDKATADNFGNYLRSQINSIKKIAPSASIMVIGPADMSIKDGDSYVTYPQLENVRDAIRLAAFQTNCAFFDMYDCMGGKNSMVSWVDQGIAATDYIHFSPAGARKIAVLLYSALMNDYNKFIQKKNNKNL